MTARILTSILCVVAVMAGVACLFILTCGLVLLLLLVLPFGAAFLAAVGGLLFIGGEEVACD